MEHYIRRPYLFLASSRSQSFVAVALLSTLLFWNVAPAQAEDLKFTFERKTGALIGAVKRLPPRTQTRALSSRNLAERRAASIASANSLLAEAASEFGLNSPADAQVTTADEDSSGGWVVRHGQFYRGIPVYGQGLASRVDQNAEAYSINGTVVPRINADTRVRVKPGTAAKTAVADITKRRNAKLSKKEVKARATERCVNQGFRKKKVLARCVKDSLEAFDKNKVFYVTQNPTLYILNLNSLKGLPGGTNELAYSIGVVNAFSDGEEIFVSARDGRVLWRSEANDSATERWVYDCSNPKGDNLCYSRLGPSSNPPYTAYGTYTFGRREGAPVRGPNPIPGESFGSTDVDTVYDMLGSDTQPNVKSLFSFFNSKFNRLGGNGLGGNGDGVCATYPTLCPGILGNDGQGAGRGIPVHVTKVNTNVNGIDLGNPRFCQPGNAQFAHFPIEEPSIKLCSGTTDPAIVAHEYAHAIPFFMNYQGNGSFNSVVNTDGESRSLNESHSDLMGIAFRYYLAGETGPIDWRFGHGSNVPVLRALSAPSSADYFDGSWKPYPDRYNSATFYCGAGDHQGVHINSTVPSHGAYLAAEGGDFNGCHLQGIGLEKILLVFNRALTHYFTPTTSFNAAYFAFTNACNDFALGLSLQSSINPITEVDCAHLARAFQAVELDLAGGCNSATAAQLAVTPSCVPIPGDFDNNGVVTLNDYKVLRCSYGQTATGLPADADNNGTINSADYDIWVANYAGPTTPAEPQSGDYDLDGDTDGADFLAWQRAYGTHSSDFIPEDGNCDGSVDAADYVVWRDNYGS